MIYNDPKSSSRDLVWTQKWRFQGLSDLHLRNQKDQKVTFKKLDDDCTIKIMGM